MRLAATWYHWASHEKKTRSQDSTVFVSQLGGLVSAR